MVLRAGTLIEDPKLASDPTERHEHTKLAINKISTCACNKAQVMLCRAPMMKREAVLEFPT